LFYFVLFPGWKLAGNGVCPAVHLLASFARPGCTRWCRCQRQGGIGRETHRSRVVHCRGTRPGFQARVDYEHVIPATLFQHLQVLGTLCVQN